MLAKLGRLITNKGVISLLDELAQAAEPIVSTIHVQAPKPTAYGISAAAAALNLPVDVTLQASEFPAGSGYALLHLATSALAIKYPNAPQHLLDTAVQFAVTALKNR